MYVSNDWLTGISFIRCCQYKILLVKFLPFKKRLNMNSLIANQIRTNICFISVKIFIVFTNFVALFTQNWYNNNYNNNCLSDNLSLFCFVTTSHETCHKTAWITTDYLPALSGGFIYTRLQSAERSQCRRFMISLSREFYSLCVYFLIFVWALSLVQQNCLLFWSQP